MSKQKNAIAVRAIGIDTGKNTLHLIGLDGRGEVVLREKVSRNRIAARLVNVPPCLIGIEGKLRWRHGVGESQDGPENRRTHQGSC